MWLIAFAQEYSKEDSAVPDKTLTTAEAASLPRLCISVKGIITTLFRW